MEHKIKAIRVCQFGGPEVLNLEELDHPQPKSGEVLIRANLSAALAFSLLIPIAIHAHPHDLRSSSPEGKCIAPHSDSNEHSASRERRAALEGAIVLADASIRFDQKQIASSVYDNDFPQWSPDDARVIFASTRDGDYEIYTMAPDGSNSVRMTFVPGRDAHPYYMHSGKHILFQSPRDHSSDHDVDLYVMDPDGKNQRRLRAMSGFNGVPVPSPDNKKIAFMRGTWLEDKKNYHWEVLLADIHVHHVRQVTNNPWSSQVPSWFPNSREIALFADPTGKDQLFVLDTVSGSVRKLVSSDANDRAPSVSPNGKFVAFTSDRDGGSDLYLLEIAAGSIRRLTNGLKLRGQPGWARDGKRIVFAGAVDDTYDVYIIGIDDLNVKRLTYGAPNIDANH